LYVPQPVREVKGLVTSRLSLENGLGAGRARRRPRRWAWSGRPRPRHDRPAAKWSARPALRWRGRRAVGKVLLRARGGQKRAPEARARWGRRRRHDRSIGRGVAAARADEEQPAQPAQGRPAHRSRCRRPRDASADCRVSTLRVPVWPTADRAPRKRTPRDPRRFWPWPPTGART
jgi:hypothetical protein